MFVPDRKHTYRPPRLVTGIALLFYVQMMVVPHRRHTYRPPPACYGDSFTFLCADDGRTTQETYIQASPACYGDSFTFLTLHSSQCVWQLWICSCWCVRFTLLIMNYHPHQTPSGLDPPDLVLTNRSHHPRNAFVAEYALTTSKHVNSSHAL
jgi:hypothetical protein